MCAGGGVVCKALGTVVSDRGGRESEGLSCNVVGATPLGYDVEGITTCNGAGVDDGTAVGIADGIEPGE